MTNPDLKLDGLSVWIDGWQFPDETDYWDGNWLNIRAEMKASGSRVTCGGAILRTDEIRRFRNQLKSLHETVQGSACLDPMEPGLKVTCAAQTLGAIEITIEIRLTICGNRMSSYPVSTNPTCRRLSRSATQSWSASR